MLYILLGQDDFSLRQALEEIKRGIGDQALLEANTVTLDGRQVTLEQLRTVCGTIPFLAEKRLVIINGLLSRFEPKGKTSRKREIARTTNQQGEYKALSECISNLPDSTVLVLIDGKIGSNNPLLKALSSKAEVRTFPLLSEAKLRQWVQRRVTESGGAISPTAAVLLARLVGSNLWIMANEIDKLILFTAGRHIEEEDVKAVVSYAQEANVFAMVDAILEFKAGVAEHSLQQLLQRGASLAYLLTMILRQVEMLVLAKELRKQGKSKTEIQNRLGLTSEFALRKTLEQADRYSWGRIRDIYRKLLEADLAIKTGRYDGELALDILITELCQR